MKILFNILFTLLGVAAVSGVVWWGYGEAGDVVEVRHELAVETIVEHRNSRGELHGTLEYVKHDGTLRAREMWRHDEMLWQEEFDEDGIRVLRVEF